MYFIDTILLTCSTSRRCSGCVFFFQAEDGIRDLTVTGVQTCALPISYAAARGTQVSIFLWALLLFGATVALLLLFRHRLNQRITEPVKAAGAIASRVAGGDLSVTVVTQRA